MPPGGREGKVKPKKNLRLGEGKRAGKSRLKTPKNQTGKANRFDARRGK